MLDGTTECGRDNRVQRAERERRLRLDALNELGDEGSGVAFGRRGVHHEVGAWSADQPDCAVAHLDRKPLQR